MNNILKQLRRQVYLMQQVHEAKLYIVKAEQLAHPHLMRSLDEIWGVLLAFRGAIISYAKCFAKTGRGKVKLEMRDVFAGRPELVDGHRRIIDLRNKYVAHSDDNEMESASIELMETQTELVVRLQYDVSFSFDRMYELRELIKHLDGHVATGLEKTVRRIEQRLGKTVRIEQGSAGW